MLKESFQGAELVRFKINYYVTCEFKWKDL